MELKVSVPDLRDYAKNLPNIKENLFQMLRLDIKTVAEDFLNGLMNAELELFLGRPSHERQNNTLSYSERNYRNGHYSRQLAVKGLGKLTVKIPRDRQGQFKTNSLAQYQRVDQSVQEDISMLYLLGTSTRALSLISERLVGTKISHSQVSTYSRSLIESVEKWRSRPIDEPIKYLYLDGTNFRMRVTNSVETVCVLVIIGVTECGHKKVLLLQAGDKESSTTWRQAFKDLKSRGLNPDGIKLGIMDGLPGLEKVFKSEFPKARTQRCQVHVARNILCKVPKKLKQEVADDVRSIFYAKSKKKAMAFLKEFKSKWEKDLPSATKCLESSINSTLTYLNFPEEEWISLRTTNPIERLNKEFKRRTKSMEIVANESSCYNLLAVISLRMELYWSRHPINFQKSLPWFKEREFTQKI